MRLGKVIEVEQWGADGWGRAFSSFFFFSRQMETDSTVELGVERERRGVI